MRPPSSLSLVVRPALRPALRFAVVTCVAAVALMTSARGAQAQYPQQIVQVDRSAIPDTCSDPLLDVKYIAVNALRYADSTDGIRVLKKVLAKRDMCSAPLRRQAIGIMGQRFLPAMMSVAVDVASHDPDAQTKAQASQWLVRHIQQSKLASIELVKLYTDVNEQNLRATLLRMFIERHDDLSVDKLISVAKDKNDPLRQTAASYLSQSREPEVVKGLSKVLAE